MFNDLPCRVFCRPDYRLNRACTVLGVALCISAYSGSAIADSTGATADVTANGWYTDEHSEELSSSDDLHADSLHLHNAEILALKTSDMKQKRLEQREHSDVLASVRDPEPARRSDYFHGYVTDISEQGKFKLGTAQHFHDIGKFNQAGPIYDPRFDRIIEGSTVEGANLFMRADIHWPGVFVGD